MFHRLHPFKKVSWKVLKHLEHYNFRYNIVTETYEYRARKLQHDFVEIDRHIHNDRPEFLHLNFDIIMSQNCRMLVFSVTSLSFSENVWTKIFLGAYVISED